MTVIRLRNKKGLGLLSINIWVSSESWVHSIIVHFSGLCLEGFWATINLFDLLLR